MAMQVLTLTRGRRGRTVYLPAHRIVFFEPWVEKEHPNVRTRVWVYGMWTGKQQHRYHGIEELPVFHVAETPEEIRAMMDPAWEFRRRKPLAGPAVVYRDADDRDLLDEPQERDEP
jgi:hypothetical protein